VENSRLSAQPSRYHWLFIGCCCPEEKIKKLPEAHLKYTCIKTLQPEAVQVKIPFSFKVKAAYDGVNQYDNNVNKGIFNNLLPFSNFFGKVLAQK
jgi:hypothetical protein